MEPQQRRSTRKWLSSSLVPQSPEKPRPGSFLDFPLSAARRAAPTSQRSESGIEHPVQIPAHVLRKKAQHEVPVFLQQQVLAAVSAIGDRIGEMLVAVEFHGDAGIGGLVAQQIDLQLPEAVEGDRQHGVEPEAAPRLWQRLQAVKQSVADKSMRASRLPWRMRSSPPVCGDGSCISPMPSTSTIGIGKARAPCTQNSPGRLTPASNDSRASSERLYGRSLLVMERQV